MKNQDHLNQVLALLLVPHEVRLSLLSQSDAHPPDRTAHEPEPSRPDGRLPAFLRSTRTRSSSSVRDLLISVTNFFREPEAFQALETDVIVPLVRGPGARTLRCGSGSPAAPRRGTYSLAMLLLEQLAQTRKACPLQIFATDLDEDALEPARPGHLPRRASPPTFPPSGCDASSPAWANPPTR